MSSTVPHQALYRVWRAQTFAGIVGQEAAVTAIRNAVRTNRLAHALLFVGPRGTGKTSMARIVAKALNCADLRDGEPCDTCHACVAIREGTSLDVAELDAASNNRVDDIRELLPRIATAPSDLRHKVFIVDEVQRIKEGWDVLLKTLEEPPDHVAFIFCTTDAGGIRPAVLSRVQRFDFRKLTVEQIGGKLRRILATLEREADEEAVELIARLAAGGMRDAESMLDQLLSGGSDRLTVDRVRDLLGLAGSDAVDGFLDALVAGNALAGLGILDELEDRGRDPRAFLDQVLEALRATLVTRMAGGSAGVPHDLDRLVVVGRRLASIDPARLGPGGLRFQLDLVLLDSSGRTRADSDPAPQTGWTVSPATEAIRAAQPAEPGPSGESGGRRAGTGAVASARPGAGAGAAPRVGRRSGAGSAAEPLMPEPPPPSSGSAAPTPAAPTTSAASTKPVRQGGSPAPTSASAPTPASGLPDLAALQACWPSVVADLSQQPAVKPLIVACRPIAVDERVVTLGFPEHQSFLKDLLERRRATVEDGIARQTGRPVSVRFVATNIDVPPPAPTEADGDRLLAEARRIFADDLVDIGEVS